jgi:hypothetical protein
MSRCSGWRWRIRNGRGGVWRHTYASMLSAYSRPVPISRSGSNRRIALRVFDVLAERLKESPPPPKPIRVVGDTVAWKRGQLWAYRTLDGKYVVLRVAAFDPECGLVGAPVALTRRFETASAPALPAPRRECQDSHVREVASPTRLAIASGSWLLVLLTVVGIGSITFEILIARPEVLRFASAGRLVVGQVTSTPNVVDLTPGERPRRHTSSIFVDDPELGPQTVEVYGGLLRGQQLPVLCLTSAQHCESADVIHERLSLWPLTPIMLSGGCELVLAAILLYTRRRARRRSHHRAPLS